MVTRSIVGIDDVVILVGALFLLFFWSPYGTFTHKVLFPPLRIPVLLLRHLHPRPFPNHGCAGSERGGVVDFLTFPL